MQTQSLSNSRFNLAPIMFGLSLIFMIALAYFGGVPEDIALPYFLGGVFIMIGVGAVITFFAWYMLFRPLPDNYAVINETPLSATTRQFIGLALVIGMSLATIGAIWDELWHWKYGIPFGEDLLWRPHLMIYTGLLSIVVIAAMTGWLIMRKGRGALEQRLRADMYLGLVIVVGLYFAYSLPADPIWHIIYGDDITAFSIPHVLLGFSLVITQTIGAGIILAHDNKDDWRGIHNFELRFIVPLIAFAFSTLTLAMVFVTTFVNLAPEIAASNAHISSLPIWLLPVFLISIPTLMGTLANHSLKRAGAATTMVVIALIVRFVLSSSMGIAADDILNWLALLPAAVGVDVAAAVQLSRGEQPNWRINLSGVIAMLPITILVMGQYYLFPELTASNFIQFLIFPSLVVVVITWLGTKSGDYLASQQDTVESQSRVSTQRLTGIAITAYAILLIFTAIYFVTATPPVVEVASIIR